MNEKLSMVGKRICSKKKGQKESEVERKGKTEQGEKKLRSLTCLRSLVKGVFRFCKTEGYEGIEGTKREKVKKGQARLNSLLLI